MDIELDKFDELLDSMARKKAENEDIMVNEKCNGCRFANSRNQCDILNKVYKPNEKPCPFKKQKEIIYDYVLRTALEGKRTT